MLKDAYTSYFSVPFDEATNNESKEELLISKKYWFNRQNEIILTHLESVFFDKSGLSLNRHDW